MKSPAIDRYAPNRELKAFIDSQPQAERRYYSAIIRRACLIEPPKYYAWLGCQARIEPLYRKKIEEVTGQKIFSDYE